MRALYLPGLQVQDSYQLEGDLLHHLVSVVRVECQEELLLLNGEGLAVTTVVDSVSKKVLGLRKLADRREERKYEYDLVLGIPKKEALELSLKEATELGFRKVYLVRARYSQTKIPEADRLKAVLISALEQANASYLPLISEVSWEDLPWNEYGGALLLTSESASASAPSLSISRGPRLLIVGPEGGFSPEELELIGSKDNVEALRLPTPILRTPTAVATGAGILLQRLLDR